MGKEYSDSDLCVKCGLCCSGALFDFGPLSEDEAPGARDAGMDVIERDGKTAFNLPCPCLDGAFCTVYHQRPSTCRTYRCTLLRSLEAGMITFAEAEQRIEQGLKALADLEAQLPEGASASDARRWRREAGQAGAVDHLTVSPNVMIALGLLDVVMDQHFRRVDQRQVMPRE